MRGTRAAGGIHDTVRVLAHEDGTTWSGGGLHTERIIGIGSARLAAHETQAGVPALIAREYHVMLQGLLTLRWLRWQELLLVHEALMHAWNAGAYHAMLLLDVHGGLRRVRSPTREQGRVVACRR